MITKPGCIDCGCLGCQEVNLEFKGSKLIGVWFVANDSFNIIDEIDFKTIEEIEEANSIHPSAKFLDSFYLAKEHLENKET